MILNPYSTSTAPNPSANRNETLLVYKWGSAGQNQTDVVDTVNGLITASHEVDILGIPGLVQDIVVIDANIYATGFDVRYVKWADATILEKARATTDLVGVGFKNFVAGVKTTVDNFTSTFSLSGMWDDLKKILGEAGVIVLIVLVILVALYFWSKRK